LVWKRSQLSYKQTTRRLGEDETRTNRTRDPAGDSEMLEKCLIRPDLLWRQRRKKTKRESLCKIFLEPDEIGISSSYKRSVVLILDRKDFVINMLDEEVSSLLVADLYSNVRDIFAFVGSFCRSKDAGSFVCYSPWV
jgi:hypothetical protein